jgi:tellurite resistance-related uncharacterized protein
MKELPVNVKAYKKTPIFDQDSVPKGLLRDHCTKENVWGKICVLEGSLLYTINSNPPEKVMLNKENFGVVEPEVLHFFTSLHLRKKFSFT